MYTLYIYTHTHTHTHTKPVVEKLQKAWERTSRKKKEETEILESMN